MGEIGRTTRTTVLVALFLAVLMLGLPSFQLGGHDISAVDNASAAARERLLRMSVIQLTTTINTLNPMTYTMGQEMDVIYPCYSLLLQRDTDAKLIGDLATSWSSSPDGLIWHLTIVHTAQFYNRLDTVQPYHPLTWADVRFTLLLCRDSVGNSYKSYFPTLPSGLNILKDVTRGADDYSFDITLNGPYAPFLNAMSSIPILPEYIWATQKWDWANYASGIAPCVGSGPFYYTLDGMPTGSVIELARNDNWFATEERGWQSHVTKIVWKSETGADSNLADFQNNQLDVMDYVTGTQYNGVIATWPGAIRQQSSSGFELEFCLNEMPDATRRALGGIYNHGSNNQLLLDETVKLAMAMSIDHQAIVDGALQGLAHVGDTFIPDANPWHYTYGLQASEDPINGRAPVGEERVQFDPVAARHLLNAAGWEYDELGNPNPDAYPLAKIGGNDVLRFRFFSVNTQTFLDPAARQVIPWMKTAGIDLETFYTVKSSNDANSAWKSCNYDTWMWDWEFTPTSDPTVDILEVTTTMSLGAWNGLFWFNASYNDLYNQSLVEMDPAARMVILDEMQRRLYDTHADILPAYSANLFAVSTVNGEKWQNWGDWSAHWTLVPEQLYPWLYMQIYPEDNPSPQVTPLESVHEDTVNHSFSLGLSAVDNGPMEYRFFFGDGTKTAWQPDQSVPKSYSADGIYTVYMAAREVGSQDSFIGWNKMEVVIKDLSNDLPANLKFTVEPSTPTSGDIVFLNGTATDNDTLYYTWDFGDGHVGTGQKVTHQFAGGVDSTVTMYVDDHHLGRDARPNSTSKLVPVSANTAPTCVVPNYPNVTVRHSTTFTVTSNDPDPRDHVRYTWIWGDGGITVTTVTSADHTYKVKKDFTLVVWADDLTSLPLHNVSGHNLVHVTDPNNHAPILRAFVSNNTFPYTGQVVNFSARATDADGDYLTYTFTFGDGASTVYELVDAGLTVYAEHVYTVATTPDVYTVFVSVHDGQAPPVASTGIDEEVFQGNRAPTVDPLPERWVTIGDLITFTATATDPDGNPLNYSWEFGDGTWGFENPTTHTFTWPITQIAYKVHVNDGHGANVTQANYIHVAFALNLVSGWNFVTVPLVGFGYMASTLGLMDGDIVAGYNPETGVYDQIFVVGFYPPEYDFAISESTGYWISAGAAETLQLYGSIPTVSMSRTITVPAGGGWAIVGFNTLKTTMLASDIPGMFSGGTIDVVASYDPVTGEYTMYITEFGFYDFPLVPGHAYWCACSASGTLTYVP